MPIQEKRTQRNSGAHISIYFGSDPWREKLPHSVTRLTRADFFCLGSFDATAATGSLKLERFGLAPLEMTWTTSYSGSFGFGARIASPGYMWFVKRSSFC